MRWLDGITKVNGREFEQTLGDSGQGTLSPWSHIDREHSVRGVTMSQT